MRIFKEAQNDFFASTVTFVLSHLTRSPFRSYHVGDMAAFVAERLIRSSGAYLSLMRRARLVNVKAWRTRFSYGLVDPTVHPANNHLVFTFAIDRPQPFLAEDDPRLLCRILSNYVRIYGTKENPIQYICVGLNSTECARFGITNTQARALRYLYMAAGVVFRSIFHRLSPLTDMDPTSFASAHEGMARIVVSQRPLNMVFQLPYEEWVWQKSVWKLCPNLIASRCLNPYSVGRYLEICDQVNIDYKDAAYDMVWDDPSDGDTVFSFVRRSLLSFIQAVNTQSMAEPDRTGLLMPCLLYSTIFERRLGMPLPADQLEAYRTMVSAFDERKEQLSELFTPYDLSVRRLMRGDASNASKLIKALDVFD